MKNLLEMLFSKDKIIIFGALIVSALIATPRVMLLVFVGPAAEVLGISVTDIVYRLLVLFGFCWAVLSYNLKWKDRFFAGKSLMFNGLVYLAVALVAAILITMLNTHYPEFFKFRRRFFFANFFGNLFVLAILLLIGGFWKLNSRHQQELREKEQLQKENIKNQLDALRNQINPHFLFNALNSLNALIVKDREKAGRFVGKLSYLLRFSLHGSADDLITLQKELEILRAYFFLQQQRFGDNLKMETDIPDNWLNERIPSLSLQLLVENTIKHNTISKKMPMQIRIETDSHYLVVRNPIRKKREVESGPGLGLLNLSRRFELLKKGKVDIVRDEHHFTVKLPLR